MTVEPGKEPEIVHLDRVPVAVVREKVPMDQLVALFDRGFGQVADELERQQVGRTGAAIAIYHGAPAETVDVAVGFPVQRPVSSAGPVLGTDLPEGRVVRVLHVGAYDRLQETYDLLAAFAARHGEQVGDLMWESYLTEPSPEMDPARLLTEVSWLLRD